MKKILLILLLLITPITVNAESHYLYDVLKDEAESNGLAKEYTGEHHDSFTEEPSKKIYHWYAENDNEGSQVLEKNNVIFANHCWQMIRTTDTGGVKMLYNGEVEDGKCLNTRGTHVGYSARTLQNLASEYWYGTDYIYDASTKKYKITGETEKSTWNENTKVELIGKYTCKSNEKDSFCDTLYLVESYYTPTTAYVLSLSSNIKYSTIGDLPFSSSSNSLGYSGYMYGDLYNVNWTTGAEGTFSNAYHYLLSSAKLDTSYWYADSYQYDSTTKKYTLINPFKVSNPEEYKNLKGKYTFRNTDENFFESSIYYIQSVNDSYMYYKQLSNGNAFDNNLVIGDSITDNNNDTYTINNPQTITLDDWINNYQNYKHKYTCNDSSITCTNPYLITLPQLLAYQYTRVNNKMLVAKRRNGLQLLDTRIVRGDDMELLKNELQDYIYTCTTTSDICTENNIKRITEYYMGYYYYVNHYYFGSDVTWDGSKYTLVDPIDFDDYYNNDKKNTHHYMCMPMGEKTCTTVSFVGRFNTGNRERIFYINLSNGEKIEDALQKVLKKNTKNSILKASIDAWFHKNMLDYSDYLEDTIFCNNRTLKEGNGWSNNGDLNNEYSFFDEYYNKTDLDCKNITDQFSVSNPNAKLKYKTALLRTSELTIMNNKLIASSATHWWTISPRYYHAAYQVYNDANNNLIAINGSDISSSIYVYDNSENNGVRPAISLIPKIKYSSGNGSKDNPYIVDLTKYYGIDVEINNETEDLTVEINDLSQVEEGETVNFKVTPIKGHKVTSIKIIDEDNNEIEYNTSDNKNFVFTMPSSDVTIIPSYERVKNAVNVEDNKNTKEFVIEVNDSKAVVYEDTVKFRVEPKDGYEVEKIDITDKNKNNINYKKTSNKNEYEFIMPDTDVLIKPYYRLIPNNNSNIPNPNTKRQVLLIVISIIVLGIITTLFIKKKKKKRLT